MLKNIFFLLKQFWRLVHGTLWLGLWVLSVVLLLNYLLRWWSGDRFFWVRTSGYFMPWQLGVLLPSLMLAALGRRYGLLLTLAVPTILIGSTFAPLFLPRVPSVLAGQTPLTVMSYNILYLNQQLDDATALIKETQPDILLLQEVTPPIARALQEQLSDLYPETAPYFTYGRRMGQVVISRYPLTPGETSFDNGRLQKAVAETPAGPIGVWNVHPRTPRVWDEQYHQFVGLASEIAAYDGPLIVGGDFNTTDQSETYHMVSRHLQNAHWEAGWGFGFSFPAHAPRVKRIPILTPIVRIDHIFYNDHFFAQRAATLSHSGGSDHYPVVAELFLIQ